MFEVFYHFSGHLLLPANLFEFQLKLLLFLGVYCIYIAVRKGPVLQLEEGNKKYKLRLRSVVKNNLVPEFEKYLRSKLGMKLTVDGSMR